MSAENIENITKSDSNFAPTFVDHHLFPDINFNEHCLINFKFINFKFLNFKFNKFQIYFPKKVINIYVFLTH